jgi:hypothetical protein
MSILSTSPTSTRHFDMGIAAALGDINAAIIIQQLHYWMNKKEVGVIIEGVKYVYNTFVDWVNEQFQWLSVWQFRKAMSLLRSLGIVKVIRYKARQWNQTNYYTIDSDRLVDYLNTSIGTGSKASQVVEDDDLRSALCGETQPAKLAESSKTTTGHTPRPARPSQSSPKPLKVLKSSRCVLAQLKARESSILR